MLARSALLHIRHVPGQGLVYMENPKVATREIERALWDLRAPEQAPANPHSFRETPFWQPAQIIAGFDELGGCEWFTGARNPFARFVSAYIDKDQRAPWARIAPTFGMSPNARPTPRELLKIMSETAPERIDHHFRPQHLNVLHGTDPLEFVGHLESMDATREWLSARGVTLGNEPRRYATGADVRVEELLNGAERSSVASFYSEDFVRFGYSADWRSIMPSEAASLGGGTVGTLQRAFA